MKKILFFLCILSLIFLNNVYAGPGFSQLTSNQVLFNPLVDVPASAQNGMVYFDSNAADFRGYNGITWTSLNGLKHLYKVPYEDPTGSIGNWATVSINAAQSVHFNFVIPHVFKSLVSANVTIIPDTTETIQWDIYLSVAAPGEAYNADDRSAEDQTQAVTQNLITNLDVSSLFSGLSAGDHVAIDFQSDTGDLHVIGFHLDYY